MTSRRSEKINSEWDNPFLSPIRPFGCFAIRQLRIPVNCSNVELVCFSQRRAAAPSNKRLKHTRHSSLMPSVLPSGGIIRRFQPPGHLGRQLSREPLDGTSSIPVAVLR